LNLAPHPELIEGRALDLRLKHKQFHAMPPLLSLSAIAKTFDNGVKAIQRLDMEVADGEFVSLVGPSGCGKSTALRIIAGLLSPDTGTVTFAGEKPEIGFVFQEPTLMPWATVWDNVYLPLRLAHKPRAAVAARIAETLAAVGLAGFEQAYPRELSGGMRMRVSIARALVTEPRLLLLDEPFAALDEFTRFKLNEDLLRLWQQHHWTVIFVTHSVFESVFLSTRIVVMTPRPGRIFAERPVDLPYPRDAALRTAPPYVAECRRLSDLLNEAMA